MSYTKSELVRLVVDAAERYGITPDIAVAQIQQESGFKVCIGSPKGALGIAQFIKATADRFGLRDRCNPVASMDAWGRYMRQLLDQFGGDYRLALAGYNAGEGNVRKYGGVPPFSETQGYVKTILSTGSRSWARTLIAQSGAEMPRTARMIGLLCITAAIVGVNYASAATKDQ